MQSNGFSRRNAPKVLSLKDRPTRLLWVDDDEQMVMGCRISAEQINLSDAAQVLDIRTYLMQGHNGLMGQLKKWRDQDGWIPDLVLVDKNIASGHGSGHDYVSEIQGSGDDWIGAVVVLHTTSPCNEEDAKHFSNNRADAYLWERNDSQSYLKKCLASLPLWRVQARNRLWNTLIDRASQGLAQAEDMRGATEFLRENTFPFLKKHLGVKHGFVRELNNAGEVRLVAYMDEMDVQVLDPVNDLDRLPLMRETINNGKCERHSITAEEASYYQMLKGRAMIGAALRAYGKNKPATGVITLVRNEKFTSDDLDNLCRLAEPLGGLLVRQRYIERRQQEQIAVRKFTSWVAQLKSEEEVCQALVNMVHERLNLNTQTVGRSFQNASEEVQAEITVRLVPPGAAVLRRIACAGDCPVDSTDISLTLDLKSGQVNSSIYHAAVKNAKTQDLRTRADLRGEGYTAAGNFSAGSKLCVPFRSRMPTGQMGAFGAVNAAHHAENAYGESQVRFVETLAQITASALMRLRSQEALKALADLALIGMDRPADEHWQALNHSLEAYAGHSVLIHLVPPVPLNTESVNESVWNVEHIEFSEPMAQAGFVKENQTWRNHFKNFSESTFTHHAIQDFRSGKCEIKITAYGDLVETNNLFAGQGVFISFGVAIPLHHQGRLVGIWELFWFTPPAFDETGLSVLAKFGQYAAGLISFQAHWLSRENQLKQAEQQARLSGAAKMFQHVLRNELFALGSRTSTLLQMNNIMDAHDAAKSILDSLTQLEDKAYNLSDFMRAPQLQWADVLKVWHMACQNMLPRANRLNVEMRVAIDSEQPYTPLMAWFDPLILQQIICVILQNALDAIEISKKGGIILLTKEVGNESEYLHLKIFNDGPPISLEVLNKLCQYPEVTTKPRGQGIALYFSATRMKDMGGSLSPEIILSQGAAFKISVPRFL